MDDAGSRTARVVAVGRAVGVADRRDDTVIGLLPAPDRAAVLAARRLGVGTGRRVAGWLAHPALRMVAVDAACSTALAVSDAAALVVLGAGFDTRAWRLPELADRLVLEVDHPATQRRKTRRLPPAAPDHRLVAADLRHDDLDAVLEGAGHDPTLPTVWLWEAVVPYLDADSVDATLRVLASRSAPGSVLLVTTVLPHLLEPAALGRGVAGLARSAMRRLGEPVRLAESDEATARRLAAHGFVTTEVSGVQDWARAVGVRVHPPTLAERLHVAQRSPA